MSEFTTKSSNNNLFWFQHRPDTHYSPDELIKHCQAIVDDEHSDHESVVGQHTYKAGLSLSLAKAYLEAVAAIRKGEERIRGRNE